MSHRRMHFFTTNTPPFIFTSGTFEADTDARKADGIAKNISLVSAAAATYTTTIA